MVCAPVAAILRDLVAEEDHAPGVQAALCASQQILPREVTGARCHAGTLLPLTALQPLPSVLLNSLARCHQPIPCSTFNEGLPFGISCTYDNSAVSCTVWS